MKTKTKTPPIEVAFWQDRECVIAVNIGEDARREARIDARGYEGKVLKTFCLKAGYSASFLKLLALALEINHQDDGEGIEKFAVEIFQAGRAFERITCRNGRFADAFTVQGFNDKPLPCIEGDCEGKIRPTSNANMGKCSGCGKKFSWAAVHDFYARRERLARTVTRRLSSTKK